MSKQVPFEASDGSQVFERERKRERERDFRLQTGLFVYRLQALYKWVVGERGFRTAKIRLSWQLYVLATKNMLKKEKKS